MKDDEFSRKSHSGFTLAELLIVVAIIAVLVAVSIPIFTSRLATAKKATCDSNCTSLQHHIVVDLMGDESKEVTQAMLKEYMEKDDAYCPDGGTYSISPSKGTLATGFTVVCSKHGAAKSFGNEADRNTVLDIMTKILAKRGSLDSGAAALEESGSAQALKELKDAGFDLESMGAKSWTLQKASGNGGPYLYWSTVDISSLKAGTDVPMMRYNVATGTYTVWSGKVTTKNNSSVTPGTEGTYNALPASSTGYTPSTSQSKEEQTYSNMLELYNELLDTYDFGQ